MTNSRHLWWGWSIISDNFYYEGHWERSIHWPRSLYYHHNIDNLSDITNFYDEFCGEESYLENPLLNDNRDFFNGRLVWVEDYPLPYVMMFMNENSKCEVFPLNAPDYDENTDMYAWNYHDRIKHRFAFNAVPKHVWADDAANVGMFRMRANQALAESNPVIKLPMICKLLRDKFDNKLQNRYEKLLKNEFVSLMCTFKKVKTC